MKPAVSVIVPTCNGAERIAACLEALRAQKTDRPYEVIVVDDGSADGTANVIAGLPGVQLLRQANAGPGAARNAGAERAQGDVLLFIDDDCAAEPDWIDRMLAALDDPEVVAAKGAYLTAQRPWVARFVQIEYEEKYDRLRSSPYVDFIDTYSAAFRREIFLAAGGYDARFPTASSEDQDFSFRLANAGCKMVFTPEARVWHTHVTTTGGYVRKKFRNGYWKVLVLMNSPNKAAGDTHTPRTQIMQIVLTAAFGPSFLALLAGPWGLLAPAAVAAAFALTALPLTLRCLRRDRPIALAAPLLILCRALALTAGLAAGLLHWRRLRALRRGKDERAPLPAAGNIAANPTKPCNSPPDGDQLRGR